MMVAETTEIAPDPEEQAPVPTAIPQLIVTATLGLGGVILYESTLSYLGLGVPFLERLGIHDLFRMADPSS